MLINPSRISSPLSETERQVIAWINQHAAGIWKYTITEMAEENFVSTATISRLIRKCGYESIADFKHAASVEMRATSDLHAINGIIEDLSEECNEAISSLNQQDIQRVIEAIKSSKKIFLVARGNTALMARYFEFQLTLLGYNASLLSDSVVLGISDNLFGKNDLVMIFTVKNSTPELAIAANNAIKKGAQVITCACIEETGLQQYSDVYLWARQKNQSIIRQYNMMSNLPLHLISRIIIDYLVKEQESST